MKTGVLWIYGLVIVDLSWSFEAHSSVSQARLVRKSAAQSHAAVVLESEGIRQVHALLQQAEMNPKDCHVEPLSAPGFCNALYKVQCGNKQVRTL